MEVKQAVTAQQLADSQIKAQVGNRPMCVRQGMWPGMQTRPPPPRAARTCTVLTEDRIVSQLELQNGRTHKRRLCPGGKGQTKLAGCRKVIPMVTQSNESSTLYQLLASTSCTLMQVLRFTALHTHRVTSSLTVLPKWRDADNARHGLVLPTAALSLQSLRRACDSYEANVKTLNDEVKSLTDKMEQQQVCKQRASPGFNMFQLYAMLPVWIHAHAQTTLTTHAHDTAASACLWTSTDS
jgi:hypothetical protein